jgi:Domain of unknown function (DUF4389)
VTAIPASYDTPQGSYPVSLDVDGPVEQARLSVLLRVIFAIPALIAAYLVNIAASVVGILAWFVILFTGKYPAGMLAFSEGAMRWTSRAAAYYLLLTDKYPPFSLEEDAAYPVRLSVHGQVDGRNRVTVFFRYFMLIPHEIVLGVLGIVAYVVVVISWFIALFTGSVPPGMHKFIAGVLRWAVRVQGYQLLLTDEYPPFSMD